MNLGVTKSPIAETGGNVFLDAVFPSRSHQVPGLGHLVTEPLVRSG